MPRMRLEHIFIDLVDKATDGKLTQEEVRLCCSNNFPEFYDEIEERINEILVDGKISVWNTMKILIDTMEHHRQLE